MKFVYFVQAGDHGPIKIGEARDVRHRVAGLQIGNHETLQLLGVVDAAAWPEFELHTRFFEDYLRGEWFRPSDALVGWIQANAVDLPPCTAGRSHAPPGVARGTTQGGGRRIADLFDRVLGPTAVLPQTPDTGWHSLSRNGPK